MRALIPVSGPTLTIIGDDRISVGRRSAPVLRKPQAASPADLERLRLAALKRKRQATAQAKGMRR